MPVISYQLFTSRRYDLDETLAMLSAEGIDHVEGFAPQYVDPARTRDLLDRHGMRMPTGHFPLHDIESDPDRCLDVARMLGIGTIVAPVLPAEERPEDRAGWRAFADRLARAGQTIGRGGLALAWHNHDYEFVRAADGSLPIEEIAETAPDLLLELDLATIRLVGEDPADWMRRYADRLIAVHLKDAAPEGAESAWTDIGDGITGYRDLVPVMQEAGVDLWVIEHEAVDEHRRFARSSATALRTLASEGTPHG